MSRSRESGPVSSTPDPWLKGGNGELRVGQARSYLFFFPLLAAHLLAIAAAIFAFVAALMGLLRRNGLLRHPKLPPMTNLWLG